MADYGVEEFLKGHRVLYGSPTADQVERFWVTVVRALKEPLDAGVLIKNEFKHVIDWPGTETRIRAKTMWNADTARGDYADRLILDEFQMMHESVWEEVCSPMLLDNNGDVRFIYTPPSIRTRYASRAHDPQYAAKLFKKALNDKTGRWAAFHFSSFDNPTISREALSHIAEDMTNLSYRQEILAEDIDETPGALWTRQGLEDCRIEEAPALDRIVVAIDPSATSTGDEAGIIGAGKHARNFYNLEDASLQGSPHQWASAAINLYHRLQADCIVAESNNGGEMVEEVIRTIDPNIRVILVHASRGKQTRAEPIAAIYEQHRAFHCGNFPRLEDELCLWVPGDPSPNRLDALVWAMTELSGIGSIVSLSPQASVRNYIRN